MYSVVLLAAMTGGSQAGGLCGHDLSWGHEAPLERPLGGVVLFFFMGPIDISPAMLRDWQEYIDALDEPDKTEAIFAWSKADYHGRMFLLGQVSVMRPKKPTPDKAEELGKKPKIENDKKDKDDKNNKDKGKKDDGAARMPATPGVSPRG